MEKKTDHWYTDTEKFQNASSKFPNHSQPKIYYFNYILWRTVGLSILLPKTYRKEK